MLWLHDACNRHRLGRACSITDCGRRDHGCPVRRARLQRGRQMGNEHTRAVRLAHGLANPSPVIL